MASLTGPFAMLLVMMERSRSSGDSRLEVLRLWRSMFGSIDDMSVGVSVGFSTGAAERVHSSLG